MILPNNGKVVVFDDNIKDVGKLLTILSKERIPYLYYHDEFAEDLPDSPIENVRLVFLDLELVTNNPDKKNIIGPIAQRLKRVLHPNNLYILIYWSTKEDKYREELEKEFENGLSEYRPLKTLTLNKAEANVKGLEYIRTALIEEIEAFKALKIFMLWESAVNNAAGSITNTFCSVFKKDDKWDKNMHGMLFQLAVAQGGNDVIKNLSQDLVLQLAMDVINANLIESAEREFYSEINNLDKTEIKPAGSGMSPGEKVKLHTKIHLISPDKFFKHFYSGNLYILKMNGLGREIIERNIKPEIIKTLDDTKTKLICLDLTPSCDYAKGKNYTRMVYGILLESKIERKHLTDGDYRYVQCPVLKFEENSWIIFDFRCIRSFSRTEFDYKFKDEPKYRLRGSLLLDIQAQLANHINRPGIITL